jgi:hypothetical protein
MAIFLDDMTGYRKDQQRQLLAGLIADPRLDQLDYQSLRSLVDAVNRCGSATMVPPQELYATSIPPTAQDRQNFAKWRQRLRAWRKSK